MKTSSLFVVLSLVVSLAKAQHTRDIILLKVQNSRIELAKAVEFLNECEPKLIGVNVDLMNCDSVKTFHISHYSTDTSMVMYPSKSEKMLEYELGKATSLLMTSELRMLGDEYHEIIGCEFIYPEGATTGFVNLIPNNDDPSLVEKFQISNSFSGEKNSYHFAVVIAFRLNERVTNKFIQSHQNIAQIDFKQRRRFRTYSINDFYGGKKSCSALKDKIVILGIDRPEEYRLVSKSKRKMSTSEIFANIACQLAGD